MKLKVFALLLAALMLTGCGSEAPAPQSPDRATNSTENAATAAMSVPDFTVYDGDSQPVKLSDFLGKPIVLNFWASWCGPCKSEMPDFQAKFEEYGEQIHFLMVNLTDGSQETVETAQGFVDGQGYTFPVYYDTDYSGAMAYTVSAVPATYFIDEAGNLVAYGKGALTGETLQRGIDMLLG